MEFINNIRRKREFRGKICASRPRLYRTAFAWCHDPDLADDLVQQTICNALENYSQLRELEALNGWIFRILARCLADHGRAVREICSDTELLGVDEYSPDIAAADQQIVSRVRLAIKRLPLEQRQVVSLVDLEGLSYAEVASALDIPVGTVMSRLSRGRRVLHRRLIAVKDIKNNHGQQFVRRIK